MSGISVRIGVKGELLARIAPETLESILAVNVKKVLWYDTGSINYVDNNDVQRQVRYSTSISVISDKEVK